MWPGLRDDADGDGSLCAFFLEKNDSGQLDDGARIDESVPVTVFPRAVRVRWSAPNYQWTLSVDTPGI